MQKCLHTTCTKGEEMVNGREAGRNISARHMHKGHRMPQGAEKLADVSNIPGQRRNAMLSRTSPGERPNTHCNNHRCGKTQYTLKQLQVCECLTQWVVKVAQRACKTEETYPTSPAMASRGEAQKSQAVTDLWHSRHFCLGNFHLKNMAWLAPSCHPTK